MSALWFGWALWLRLRAFTSAHARLESPELLKVHIAERNLQCLKLSAGSNKPLQHSVPIGKPLTGLHFAFRIHAGLSNAISLAQFSTVQTIGENL